MSDQPAFYPNDDIKDQLTYNIFIKQLKFWDISSITVTETHIHQYSQTFISQSHKIFDLREVDSIVWSKKLNGFNSFFGGMLLAYIIIEVGTTIFDGHIYLLSVRDIIEILRGLFAPAFPTLLRIFVIGSLVAWLVVFIYYFYKNVIIIKSCNDKMVMRVRGIKKEKVFEFIKHVLHYKSLR